MADRLRARKDVAQKKLDKAKKEYEERKKKAEKEFTDAAAATAAAAMETAPPAEAAGEAGDTNEASPAVVPTAGEYSVGMASDTHRFVQYLTTLTSEIVCEMKKRIILLPRERLEVLLINAIISDATPAASEAPTPTEAVAAVAIVDAPALAPVFPAQEGEPAAAVVAADPAAPPAADADAPADAPKPFVFDEPAPKLEDFLEPETGEPIPELKLSAQLKSLEGESSYFIITVAFANR